MIGPFFGRPPALFNSRRLISQYVPSLMRFGIHEGFWSTLDHKFLSRNDELYRTAADEFIRVKTALLDLAYWADYHGPVIADRQHQLLRTFDLHLRQFITVLPTKLRKKARIQMEALLNSFNAKDSHMRQRLGEVAATVYVLRKNDADLVGMEVPHDKRTHGKPTKLDVEIRMRTGELQKIEFLNIFIDDEKLNSEEDLNHFLDGRINAKVLKKTGLKVRWRGDLPFQMLPILWVTNHETTKKYARSLGERATGLELPSCIFQQFRPKVDTPLAQFQWEFDEVRVLAERCGWNQPSASEEA